MNILFCLFLFPASVALSIARSMVDSSIHGIYIRRKWRVGGHEVGRGCEGERISSSDINVRTVFKPARRSAKRASRGGSSGAKSTPPQL